ncbi:hypothetical protein DFQ30_009237, partial [Apophysomyces sp. BC1015]
MAELATIARPYAEALFGVASTDRAVDLAAWSALVRELAQVARLPEVLSIVSNPKVSRRQVAELLLDALKSPTKGTPAAENFVQMLVENHRIELLPEIAAQFDALKNTWEGAADVMIESAFALDAQPLAELVVALERKFQRKLKPAVKIKPALIGGVRVTVGDEVLDTSVRARLAAMQTALTAELIKSRIQGLEAGADVRNQGTVISVTDGIIRIHGLSDVMQGEMLEFPGNTFGLALNLERDSVGAVMLGEFEHICEGDTVKTTGRILEVPVGPELIGRVVDALGSPIDGKGQINAKTTDAIEKIAPGVIWRKSVSEPVQTGLKSIDSMVPIGRGQRELIIGDRQTGKTAVAVDAIINQKGKNLTCIYVAIGQKASSIMNVVRKLEEHGAMEYTIVVAASASDSAAMQFIAPYAGCTMG